MLAKKNFKSLIRSRTKPALTIFCAHNIEINSGPNKSANIYNADMVLIVNILTPFGMTCLCILTLV